PTPPPPPPPPLPAFARLRPGGRRRLPAAGPPGPAPGSRRRPHRPIGWLCAQLCPGPSRRLAGHHRRAERRHQRRAWIISVARGPTARTVLAQQLHAALG